MALTEENGKAIDANPELQAKLKELWKRDASVSEFHDVLTAAGLEVTMENLEETHAELQRRRGEEIAILEKVDSEQLKRVAGGGTGNSCSAADDCDMHFLDPFYQDVVRCTFSNFCDEYTTERCHVHSGTLFGLAE